MISLTISRYNTLANYALEFNIKIFVRTSIETGKLKMLIKR